MGADRIVNAVAGINEYGSPLIIVDFGTATTYCYINEGKQYMGGAIAPGIGISTEAFIQEHLNFQELKLLRPDGGVIGKNTVSAMQSGILYGYVGQVEGIVKRMKDESKQYLLLLLQPEDLASLIAKESD